MGAPRVLSERTGKWLLTLFPPLLFNRIRVTEIGEGFRSCRVLVSKSLLTRNLNGTIFGGTIYSAGDPLYAVLYWQVFARRGESLRVWLKSAAIDYRRPAATRLEGLCRLSDEDLSAVCADLDLHGRALRSHRIEFRDRDGAVCAVMDTEVYLRRTRADEAPVSGF